MSVINALLALLMIMVAGRSEANCVSVAPEPVVQSQAMEHCTDMEASLVGSEDPQTHHSDEKQAGMCHLGCPVILKAAEVGNYHLLLYSEIYLREIPPLLVGMDDIPQTPPPRFS
jgi:hypothetical protein